MRINGGYFVLRQEIFDYLNEGDDLVMDGCIRAAADGPPAAPSRYDGFWAPMDTLKERTAARGPVPHRRSPLGGVARRAGGDRAPADVASRSSRAAARRSTVPDLPGGA